MTLKQVFIVNSDLKMGKGKIAVQVAHGEVFYMSEINDRFADDCMSERFSDWTFDEDKLMKKVVLKATRDEMLFLLGVLAKENIWNETVIDKGLTQVPADSMTCIVIEPLEEQEADTYFGSYKLL